MKPYISVCVCTFKRPHVLQTIRSVLAQVGIRHWTIEIVVVDDDPEWSAQPIVEAIAATAPHPVYYVRSGARNVAAARNACLDAARGIWIAFIDDDEIAEPDWLSRLVAAQLDHGADVVKGFVRAVYPLGTPGWVKNADPYTRDYGPTGTKPKRLATGNVLFLRDMAERHQLRFNTTFGRSGGEDTDFFRRVRATGAKVVASRDAIVNEIVPETRTTKAYLLSRYKRMGRTEGFKMRLGLSSRSMTSEISKAAVVVAVLWCYALFGFLGHQFAFKAFERFWYSIGIIQGVFFGQAHNIVEA